MNFTKKFYHKLKTRKYLHHIVDNLKDGVSVALTNPRGKGDYTIYFSSIINYANKHQDKKICAYVLSNRVDVLSCYKLPSNISTSIINLKSVEFDMLIKSVKKLKDKYNGILLIDFVPQTKEITDKYQSVFDVIWNEFYKESGVVKPIPCKNVNLKDEAASLKYKKENGDYVLINSLTPSINIPNSKLFFEEVIKVIKNKYGLKVISNMIDLEGADLVINCSFNELYFYFKNAKLEVGVRSGLEDFCVGTLTPIISLIPKEENYMSIFSNLKNWKTSGPIEVIKYDKDSDNLSIVSKKIDELLKAN